MNYIIPRFLRSWMYANILLDLNLVDEWRVYAMTHPKIKSKVRSANLFLLKRKLRGYIPKKTFKGVTMNNLLDFYYE